MIALTTRLVLIPAVMFLASTGLIPRLEASPVNIISATQFRDIRSDNSVNFGMGDRHVLDVIVDNPVGTTAQASQGSFVFDLVQMTDFPTEFVRTFAFGSLPLTPWTMRAVNGPNVDIRLSNDLRGVPALPFVRNLQLIPNGLTPRLEWEIPPVADGLVQRISIGFFDDRTNFRLLFGTGNIFVTLPPTATSFTFPADLLQPEVPYVARVFLENVASPSRATTFVNFTPIPTGPAIFLPTVDSNGVFNFDFDVLAGMPVIIDPFFATGYQYAIGTGDPNFESVTLPAVGDSVFDLQFVDPVLGALTTSLDAGVPFVFPAGGVAAFTVTGIELSAALDPSDVTAFMTTVSFVRDGQFTGTMTPITEPVATPVPPTGVLLALAFAGTMLAAKRRGSRPAADRSELR